MLEGARQKMREGQKRILIVAPTGSGKTVLAAEMLGGASKRGIQSSFNVHRKELLEQTSETFDTVGIPHGLIASGARPDRDKLVQLAGVQTLANRLDDVAPPGMIVWDEAHHLVAGTWGKIQERYPDAYHIGLTATPERLDGRGLGDHFDVIVQGPSTRELIDRGYLSDFHYYAPGKPDLVGCPVRGGEYNRVDISELMLEPKLIGDVVEHYHDLAAGKRGIIFAATRAHGREIADAFKRAGVRAAHVDGSMRKLERAALVGAFKRGERDILVNVDLFGEGFDVPGIEYCGLCRPTKSLALFLQQCGRSLRVMDGKEHAIIVDHAGNAFEHGLPDEVHEWTLDAPKRSTRAKTNDDATSVHQCPECYRVTFSQLRLCPGCGYEFPIQDRSPGWADGELFRLEKIEGKKKDQERRKAEERECKTIEDFFNLAKARGYKKPVGWAKRQYGMRSNPRKFFAQQNSRRKYGR